MILFSNDTAVWSGSWTGCKDQARQIAKSNGEHKHFRIVHEDGEELQECHYEPGKRLLWLTPRAKEQP